MCHADRAADERSLRRHGLNTIIQGGLRCGRMTNFAAASTTSRPSFGFRRRRLASFPFAFSFLSFTFASAFAEMSPYLLSPRELIQTMLLLRILELQLVRVTVLALLILFAVTEDMENMHMALPSCVLIFTASKHCVAAFGCISAGTSL